MRKLLKIIPFLSGYNTTVPTYHIGKVWENRVGFQLIRMLGRQLLYKIKPKFTDIADLNLFNELEENGVIRIDNFLSKDDWEKVKVEIELIRKNVPLVPYKPSKNPSMFVRRENISENKKDYPFINKLLGENINLNSLAAGALRLKNLQQAKPTLGFLGLSKMNDDIDDDVENILHADVHYRTLKAFFYVTEINEKNAAFIYSPRSHKITKARLSYEYDMSVRVAKLKRGDRDIPADVILKRGENLRNIISPKQYKEMGISEKQFCAPENTVVMSNNLGFHRRGIFENGQTREIILINYRVAASSWFRKKLHKIK